MPSRSLTAAPNSVRVSRWIGTWPADGLRGSGRFSVRGQRRLRVERRFHPRDERVDLFLIRLPAPRRRHLPSAQLAQRLFPRLGVLANARRRDALEADSGRLCTIVVARDAGYCVIVAR